MKKIGFIFILFLGWGTTTKAQTVITWELLKDVTFVEVWSEEFQATWQVPKFGSKVKSLNKVNMMI